MVLLYTRAFPAISMGLLFASVGNSERLVLVSPASMAGELPERVKSPLVASAKSGLVVRQLSQVKLPSLYIRIIIERKTCCEFVNICNIRPFRTYISPYNAVGHSQVTH